MEKDLIKQAQEEINAESVAVAKDAIKNILRDIAQRQKNVVIQNKAIEALTKELKEVKIGDAITDLPI